MKLGEFFISLGVKGSEKTIGAVTGAKNAMGELGSTSLATKAAILGAVYAFERMMAASSQAGTNLENFEKQTGISAQTLQQYQYAGRQVGVSNEEMTASFKGVQNAMANMRLGKGAPEGLAMLAGKVGFDSNRAKSDTTYVMKKLQEYANAEHDVAMRNFVLKSFGVGETVMAGMARNAFRPDVLKRAPTYSEREIQSLDKANAAWSNLGNKVQMAFGHFNAAHGEKLVKNLSVILDKVIKIIEALIKLAEKMKLFETIGVVMEKIAGGLGQVPKAIDFADKAIHNPKEAAKEAAQGIPNFFKGIADKWVKGNQKDAETFKKSHPDFPTLASLFKSKEEPKTVITNNTTAAPSKTIASNNKVSPTLKLVPPPSPITPGAVAPKVAAAPVSNSTQNNTVNQTLQFQHDGTNAQNVADTHHKAIKQAYFQIPQGGP